MSRDKVEDYKPLKVEIPPQNRHVISLMRRDKADFAELDPDDRHEIIIMGTSHDVTCDIARSLAANAELRNGTYQIPIRGTMQQAASNPLASVIMSSAEKPVTIRRRSWGTDRAVTYTNCLYPSNSTNAAIYMTAEGKARKYHLTFESDLPLNTLDFSAGDWVMVDNPNIVESDIPQEDLDANDDDEPDSAYSENNNEIG